MRRRHRMPFGAELTDNGVRFALWAPSADEVKLVVDGIEHEARDKGEGWREAIVAEAAAGSRYKWRIGPGLAVPDPASRFQPDDAHGPSAVVDPCAYEWGDAHWQGRPWQEAVVYEVHVGTATLDGTFDALRRRLPELRDLGISAIELMPVAEFPGSRNWGYDGVIPFAPDAAYGTPEDLKRLVDEAHCHGLMVILDVVYNHFGPSGNYLHAYAERFFTDRHHTPWGAAINFDGAGSRAVRDYFVHNALYWLTEYHFDGLRLDAVHTIRDDSQPHILAELAGKVRAELPGRHIHLILENEANEARWLSRRDDGQPQLHDAQWNDDLHHAWHVLLTGERDGFHVDYAAEPVRLLARAMAEGFAFQGEPSGFRNGARRGEPSASLPPDAFISFLQNHDQIGNRALGERIATLADPERLALAYAVLILSPQVPMLFMGEEWAASSPFLFFVDFHDDPALSEAVRKGRKAEFGHGGDGADVPDPTLEATQRRSVLDWSERSRPPYADVLASFRTLLAIRQDAVIPLLKSGFMDGTFELPSPETLLVRWRFRDGVLRAAVHFGTGDMRIPMGAGSVLWSSEGAAWRNGELSLSPWSGAVLRSDA